MTTIHSERRISVRKTSLMIVGAALVVSQLGAFARCPLPNVHNLGDLVLSPGLKQVTFSCTGGTVAHVGLKVPGESTSYDFCQYDTTDLSQQKEIYLGCFVKNAPEEKTVQRLVRSDGKYGFKIVSGKPGESNELVIKFM